MSRLRSVLGLSTPFDPTHRYQTSWLLLPLALALIRLLFSIYIFGYLFYRIAYSAVNNDGLEARQSFSYFTNITYWALGFYFLFAGGHTLIYTIRGAAPLQRWGSALQFLHTLFYSSVITFPFLVTIVYWGILAADDAPFRTAFSGYSNVSAHLLNSVFALFEILLPRTERPAWMTLPFLVLFLAGYLGVAYITRAAQGFYTYDFLDPEGGNGKVAAYCVGIGVAVCVVFVVVWLLVWGRLALTERTMGRKGVFAKRDRERGEKIGVEVEVSKA